MSIEHRAGSAHVRPQAGLAVETTGLEEARQRMLVIDVEPDKLVHREAPVLVGHGAFKQPRIYAPPGGSGFIVSIGFSGGMALLMWEP